MASGIHNSTRIYNLIYSCALGLARRPLKSPYCSLLCFFPSVPYCWLLALLWTGIQDILHINSLPLRLSFKPCVLGLREKKKNHLWTISGSLLCVCDLTCVLNFIIDFFHLIYPSTRLNPPIKLGCLFLIPVSACIHLGIHKESTWLASMVLRS